MFILAQHKSQIPIKKKKPKHSDFNKGPTFLLTKRGFYNLRNDLYDNRMLTNTNEEQLKNTKKKSHETKNTFLHFPLPQENKYLYMLKIRKSQ